MDNSLSLEIIRCESIPGPFQHVQFSIIFYIFIFCSFILFVCSFCCCIVVVVFFMILCIMTSDCGNGNSSVSLPILLIKN